MRYTEVCFFSLSGVCTRYVYTYDTYVMFRPWTHTSDLGPKGACKGLTFVCLSKAKILVDLMVESMSFDRIGNLGNSSTMKARLQEEVKLVEFAQSTRVRYADMGVFSAVARNQ